LREPRERTLIKSARLVKKYDVSRGDLLIAEGKIARIEEEGELKAEAEREINADGAYLSPGFIDLHVHGGGGGEFNEAPKEAAGEEEISRILNAHLMRGTTTLLGTVLTGSLEEMRAAMDLIAARDHPQLGGIYLEGPFFSAEKKGAQPPDHLREPDLETFKRLVEGFEEEIKIFSLAPELPGALELLPAIREIGATPAIGHSNATFAETVQALNEGAELFTHVFNGMKGFHHREPGVLGAALSAGGVGPDVPVELIADGVHVSPEAIQLLLELKGADKVCLITDAMAATGMGEGEYSLGGQKVVVKEGQARLAQDGSLASSVLTMDVALKNMVQFGLSLPQAARSASLVPARVLGVEDRKGSIERGKDADLVLFDESFQVEKVLIGGESFSPPPPGSHSLEVEM